MKSSAFAISIYALSDILIPFKESKASTLWNNLSLKLTSILFSINFNYVFAETNLVIPVKKPSLTDEEIKVKISKNILKPIKKPKANQCKYKLSKANLS